MDQFEKYYQFLIDENKKYNLTAITDKTEVFIKHFEDSLALSKALDLHLVKTIVDVGSGAGFPGIPLKIKYPHLKLTIIEPNQKKCRFLEKLLLVLELNDVIIINGRAETQKTLREHFDLAVARAVGSLSLLCEICLPLVKENGFFIAMKGPDYKMDLIKANKALDILQAKIDDIIEYNLSNNLGSRTLLKIKKYHVTSPLYPRNFATITKKPL